jgi:hypothetical protein
MKTTLEIPDPLFRQAKQRAAARRVSLRALVISGLQRELSAPLDESSCPTPELAAIFAHADARPRVRGSVGPLNRETLHQRGLS